MSEYLWVLNPQGNTGMLPKLSPDQFLKLKQLTVRTLSATNKILSYNELLEEVEVCNVHELKTSSSMSARMQQGIVKGKLNQLGRCYELQFAAGRDLMHGQLGSMIDTLGIWLATSDSVFPLIEEKIDWASKMCQLDMDHQQELQGRIDESKQGLCFWENVDGFGYLGGLMEQEEDLIRSKRRRSQHNYSRGRPVYP